MITSSTFNFSLPVSYFLSKKNWKAVFPIPLVPVTKIWFFVDQEPLLCYDFSHSFSYSSLRSNLGSWLKQQRPILRDKSWMHFNCRTWPSTFPGIRSTTKEETFCISAADTFCKSASLRRNSPFTTDSTLKYPISLCKMDTSTWVLVLFPREHRAKQNYYVDNTN